jgi:hypothetical protein
VRHRAAHESAVRNGMAAAAAAGGALAVVVPTVAVTTAPGNDDAAVLRLAADEIAETDAGFVTTGGIRMVTSIVPVGAPDPEPPEFDVAGLLKGAGLADIARKAEEQRAARQAEARCDVDLDVLGGVRPWVREAARFLGCLYERPDLIGVAQRSRDSDHPRGLAIDLMVRGERGDRIAECALANQEELGVDYVIWEQRMNSGDGWERMEDRGGDTENHVDHVHISFERGAPDGEALADHCR